MVKCEKCGTEYKADCHVCYPGLERIEQICDDIIEEANRRMIVKKYHSQRSAIHEVMMKVGAKVVKVMRNEHDPYYESLMKGSDTIITGQK